ncbi:MAG: UMP kinase [Bacteroidia bacterium]|nr:MAG: UMP kinase [Bacteroidia bacterium]
MTKYKRVLLKLSGEALLGSQNSGIDSAVLMDYVNEIKDVVSSGVELAIVIGGGNIFRGLTGIEAGFDRVKGDYMGMLATMINGLGMQSAFERVNQKARLLTSIRTEPVAEFYSKAKAIEALQHKEVVIFSGGTGSPYFTTDTTAALRALEIEAEVLLKGTRVDGIYTDDPEKNPNARKFETISFDEAYRKGLKIMDLTAITMCQENKVPIVVFDMNTKGNLKKLLSGENIGTLVHL